MAAKQTPNNILSKWMKVHKKNAAEVARETGYTYGHIYQISKGIVPVTPDFVGRLLVVYGVDGPAVEMARLLRAEGNGNGGKG